MLIAMAGFKQSGKDTAAKVLIDEYGFTKISFADPVREMALAINPWIPYAGEYGTLPLSELIDDAGWDWAKEEIPEVRRLLMKIGTEAVRGILGESVWIDTLAKHYPDLASKNSRYVINDCRFENEAEFIHSVNGTIIWVNRPGIISNGHASETDVVKNKAQYILHNDSTIDEFTEDLRLSMIMLGVNH